MNELLTQVLESTKKALNQETIIFNDLDEKAFLSLLKSSGLSGIVLPYVDLNNRSDRFKTVAKSMIFEFLTKDEKQLELINQTNQLLNEKQIEHVYLKGSRLKGLYPKSYMRGMGDVDILIKESKLSHVKDLFQQHAITLEAPSPAHDLYRTKDQLIIEVHPRLHNAFNLKYGDYFRKAWENAFQKEEYLYELDPLFELLYLLYHLAKHLESSGIGLRSILDIGIFLKHYENQIDQTQLFKTLDETHMRTFYSTIVLMNEILFGIETSHVDQSFIMSPELIEKFTLYLIDSGIHGKGESFNVMVPRVASLRNRQKTRFTIFFRIVFPEYSNMKVIYPKLRSCFILYPYYCVLRWYRLMVKNHKRSTNKIKQLRESKQEKENVSNLFQQIGLD